MAADVTAGDVTTVNGATFSVSTDGGVVISDGQGGTANVVQTDIVASNGVIHVIDAVLLPEQLAPMPGLPPVPGSPEPGIGLSVSTVREGSMAHYVARIPVSVARCAAFAYVSRFDRAAEWDPGVEAGEMLTPEPVGVGFRLR